MSGPYSRTTTVKRPPPWSDFASYDKRQTWYRKPKADRVRPNPYNMIESYLLPVPSGMNDTGDAVNVWIRAYLQSYNDQQALNKASERFKEAAKRGADASLAVTLAEWQQSEKMIVMRCGQLLHAFKALKNAGANKALEVLGANQVKTRQRGNFRSRAKDLSGKWLELHFGWVPLLQDIYNAVDVLQGPLPYSNYTGRASARGSYKAGSGNFAWYTTASFEVRYRVSAWVTIDSPNLALANRMGLVNPATVAWELVPFSFLVDWFIPVGDFLNSFSDFLGYKIENPSTTTLRRGDSFQEYRQYPYASQAQRGHATTLDRVLSLPAFKLRFNTFKGFSPTRGATAVALVLQQFLPRK